VIERGAAAALGLLCLLPAAGGGQELVAGWEGDLHRGYAFASPVLSAGLGAGHVLVLRGAASYLYYRFPEAAGPTHVRSPGLAAGLAWRLRGRRGSATIGPGFELRTTERRPAGAVRTRNLERGFTAQGDVFLQPTPLTTLIAIASYGHANRYVWARAGAKRQLTNTRFTSALALGLGIEVTAQGNADSRAWQAGALLALDLPRARTSLQLRGGYTRLRYPGPGGPGESRPYMGVGFYRAL
jgi:hypothetical protein